MAGNILYITYREYFGNPVSGVITKIAAQTLVLQEAGYHADRVNQYGSSAQLVDCTTQEARLYRSPLGRRWSVYKAVQAALREKKYIAAYIRFQFFSEDVLKICSHLKKNGVMVLMEFPTYPYEGELHQQGTKGQIKLLCDKLYRRACAKYIDAFVTQAEDHRIYGVPCIHVLNGLDYAAYPMRTVRPAPADEIHMVAVASMLPWHGYDRLLNGMAAYYRSGNATANFVLHLVGHGKETAKYTTIVENEGLDSHVVFHGAQQGHPLEQIVSGCHIAVGSLGAHRIGLKKLSTLKSREYCAWGLPTVNSTPTDILSPENPFCIFVPQDESPVDMEAVAAFYHRVYFESGLSAEAIAQAIRQQGISSSDIHQVFLPVVDHIQQGSSL